MRSCDVLSAKTLREALMYGTKFLEEAEVPDASYDAWSLFSYVLGMDRSKFFMHQMDSCEGADWISDYCGLLEKRAARIPLQQILGSAAFMEYEFFVNEHVLTPRQDTETLVENAFARMEGMYRDRQKQCRENSVQEKQCREDNTQQLPLSILDMCTGSGCIAISLYCMAVDRQIPVKLQAADLSKEALKVAAINNERLTGGSVELIHSDLFEALEEESYDMILSNPPYIPSDVCETLMPEVKEHEPRMALDGKEDGLYYYRILTREGVHRLKPGGYMAFEIGYDQGEAVSFLMKEAGLKEVRVIKDLAGLDRVVEGRMPDGY